MSRRYLNLSRSPGLSSRKSKMPFLIAASLRPTRRPPATAEAGAVLRLASDRDEDGTPAFPDATTVSLAVPPAALAAALEDGQQALRACRAAEEAICRIQSVLNKLEGLTRLGGRANRRSPKQVARVQSGIDAAVDEVERIVAGTECAGRRILDGTWSVLLTEPTSGRRSLVRIGSFSAEGLGTARVGFLSAIRSGGAGSVHRAGLRSVRAIICSAGESVSRYGEELRSLLTGVIAPLTDAAAVAVENADAARRVAGDADFTVQTGRLKQVDVLASTSQRGSRLSLSNRLSVLNVTHAEDGFDAHVQ
jgi:hypothetical protein